MTAPPLAPDLVSLTALLQRRGHARGTPVAISMFHDEIPEPYVGQMVEPCAIVRQAMDFGEHCYVDATHHSCLAGAWQAGFIDPPDEISSGEYLHTNTPFFTREGARVVKNGENVLPRGTVVGIGACPLDEVPDGVQVDTIVVVCEPLYASMIGGVRVAIDGTPPRGAAGTSLCGELFALPFHDRNVIITTGDVGGRMFNHTKPSEMFVIIPYEYATLIPNVLEARPDLTGLMEAIKPGYTADRERKRADRARRAAGAGVPVELRGPLRTSMDWDDDALSVLGAAPEGIRNFAVPTLEDYAREHDYERITMDVMAEQLESVGMRMEDVLDMAEAEAASAAPVQQSSPSGGTAPPDLVTTADDLGPAPVVAAVAIEVAAPIGEVWAVLAAPSTWNNWYPDIRNVKLIGPIGPAAEFTFSTGPAKVSATIDAWEPPNLLRFVGRSRGSTAIYRFRLTATPGGVIVELAQATSGIAAKAMRPMMQKIADTSLPQWLEALRVRCEG